MTGSGTPEKKHYEVVVLFDLCRAMSSGISRGMT
jgi:hypothetical protein